MTIYVGLGYDKNEQEKQVRMPILLPQSESGDLKTVSLKRIHF